MRRKGFDRYRYTTNQYQRFIGRGVPSAPYDGAGNSVWGYVVYLPKLHTPECAIVDRADDRLGWVACTLAEPVTCRRADTADDAVDAALAAMQAARR